MARLDLVVAAGRDTAVTEGTGTGGTMRTEGTGTGGTMRTEGTGTGGMMRTEDMEGGSPTLSQGRMNTATECR